MTRSFTEGMNRKYPEIFLPPGRMPCINLANSLACPIIPISDLYSTPYRRDENILRNKVATLYRLVDLFQWSQGIYNHITARLNSANSSEAEILINPFGLLYNEITASSLIKISLKGQVLDPGSSNLGINQAGYVLHSAIHEARPDVHCIIHLHTAVVSAVSSMKCGLLPICQEAMIIGQVGYHDYQGIVCDKEEKRSIANDLADKNVLLLRNHGFVACGQTVEDALHLAFHTIIACETQIRATRIGIDKLVIPIEAAERTYRIARHGGGGVNKTKEGTEQSRNGISDPVWAIGELEWEAWMRVLDSMGFVTGHQYKKMPTRKPRFGSESMCNLSKVATPPAIPPANGKLSPFPDGVTASPINRNTELANIKWITASNNYQRIRFFEGSNGAQLTTKWIPLDEITSTPIKCTLNVNNEFSPLRSSPREFRQKRQQMKEKRISCSVSPGPQSRIFGGSSSATNSDTDCKNKAINDASPVLIGAASRGIINRDQRHNAQLFSQLFVSNPFSSETDEAMEKYMREIEAKSHSTPQLTGFLSCTDKQHSKNLQSNEAKQNGHYVGPKNGVGGLERSQSQRTTKAADRTQNGCNKDPAQKETNSPRRRLKRFLSFGNKKK